MLKVRIGGEDEINDGAAWLVFPPEHSLLYRNSRLCRKPGALQP